MDENILFWHKEWYTFGMEHKPFVVGLTGNIATGKSTILSYLAEKGAHILDADKLAHQTMAPDGPAYANIVGAFGTDILNEDQTISRPALGQIVFGAPDALQMLEEIVHPAVYTLGQEAIESTDAAVVILEAIKLLDGGQTVNLCDTIWVVTSELQDQLQRLMTQRGMDEDEAHRRMNAQSSQADKVARADRVIDNSGTLDALHAQLDELWSEALTKVRT